ncbi:MAG: cache domain-containing protein, partial [Bdellovibrionaceae bacterium]|nr:cache domain-containing protein [Pseudobdellovibrionaceae bacterium]
MEKIKNNWKSLAIFVLGGLFSAVPLSLVILFIELPKLEQKIENSKKVEIKIAVSSIEKILDFFYNKEISGELPTDKAQKQAAEVIQNLRYSGNEYFWLHNLDLKMIMHPMKPELNGKDLSTIKDPEGKFLFVEMNKVITSFGSGYVDYLWPRPGEDKPIPKSSFVSLFKPWGWVLGSGVYVDNIRKEIQQTREQSVSWLVIGSLLASVISILVGLRLLVKLVFPI